MRLHYVIVEVEAEGGGTKQLPVLFSHAWTDEQVKASVLAIVPNPKVVAEGSVLFVNNRVQCEGAGTAFGGGSRGRHDEILIESAEHL